MKRRICLALMLMGLTTAAFAYTYDTNLPLPGNSIAGAQLQKETLFSAYAFAHRIAPVDCTAFSITNTNVSKPKADDKWQEIWTIKTCSKTAYVPINFEIRDNLNIYAIDPMGVKYAK